MSGRIPQSFIDELLARTDIVEVIDSRVPLKKAGREFTACCPFHDEKTPSFSVSPSKQFYHCFGCGAHGSALRFLMEYERMEFVDAVEELAARAGMQVPREATSADRGPRLQPLYDVMASAQQFYRRQLREHPQAHRAVAYLRERGLDGKTAEAFGLGYAPPGWDNLVGALGQANEARKSLINTGMIVDKGDRCYDRFRDRIMFPIVDGRGRVIAFGGRVLGDDTPKYLNSPETPIFHKGRELYGLYQARQRLRQLDRLLVVEGYMDVVALAQFGIHYAVATLGTATTRDHLERLFRTTSEVVFCFDGDRAGRQAAERAMDNLLPVLREGRQARFLFLPEGEDPDSMVRHEGTDAFTQRIANAVPFSEFLFEFLGQRADMHSVDGRARLAELARPLLAKLPPGVFRDMMIEQLAQRVRTDARQLARHIAGDAPAPPLAPAKPGPRVGAGPIGRTPPSPVRRAVSLLLLHPELATQAGDAQRFQHLDLPGTALLVEMIELLKDRPHLNAAALIEHWHDREEGKHLAKLARQEHLIEANQAEAEFSDVLQLLDAQAYAARADELLEKSRLASLSTSEKDELRQLLSRKTAATGGQN